MVGDERVDQAGQLARGGVLHLAGDGKVTQILGGQRPR